MYLVDTNVLSEARRGSTKPRAWLRSIDPLSVFLSVVTLGEIMRGIVMKAKSDPAAANILREWLETLRRDHAARILPVTDPIAMVWGRLAAERTRPMADGLIAATAIVHQKMVVTRNVSDFADAGVQIVDPWAR
jgi:predicted nucleic acid-binding protein